MCRQRYGKVEIKHEWIKMSNKQQTEKAWIKEITQEQNLEE